MLNRRASLFPTQSPSRRTFVLGAKMSRLLVVAASLGACDSAAEPDDAGQGGGPGTTVGSTQDATTSATTQSNGTGTGSTPTCTCDLAASGCGARLSDLASAAGCEIPIAAGHEDDLLSCADGVWSVQEACAGGCVVGADPAADACASGMPSVEMDWLVLQSQVEPFRGDQPDLPGDAAVKLVQAALADEGFDAAVDGWFGNGTATSYADWQKQLGYSGLDANGIPGPSSLAMLGVGRFEVVRPIAVGGKTTHSGRTVNERTKAMILEAEDILGFPIVVSQGSYNAGGVAASAGTHDGGGAIDVSVSSLSTSERWKTVEALRTVGFAAWLRNPNQGDWPYHIHAIAMGDTDVSTGARNQIADYFVGKNGLASHAADDTPDAYQVPFTWWEEYQEN